jgi:DNA polymerase-3 subunit delta
MILLVYGDDGFRVKERVKEFVKRFQEKHDPAGLNYDEIVFSIKSECDCARVADAITASPFLAEKRMVRVNGVLSFVTTKSDAARWATTFERVPQSTIVVLVDVGPKEKIEKTDLFKRITAMKDVHVYPYGTMSGSELRAWVQQRAIEHGATLVPAIADRLIDRVGSDSWRLENEIAKLSAYAGSAPIDETMIRAIVSTEYHDDMFGMIDALSSGKAVFALQKLAEERAAGVEEFPLFGMIARHIRLLLCAKAYCEEHPHAGKQDIADAFEIHPFVAQKALAEAKRYSFAQIRAWHTSATELDSAMKRGLSADLAVDRLVAALLDAS